jgi:hypothetical protein
MSNNQKIRGQQPDALAELAETSREKIPGDGPRSLDADEKTKPISTDNDVKHDVAEKLLAAGAHGQIPDAKEAGVDRLPDRTRTQGIDPQKTNLAKT